jgi:hypothetical protein
LTGTKNDELTVAEQGAVFDCNDFLSGIELEWMAERFGQGDAQYGMPKATRPRGDCQLLGSDRGASARILSIDRSGSGVRSRMALDLPAHGSSFVSCSYKVVALSGKGMTVTFGDAALSINGPDRAEINDIVGQSKSRRLPSGELEFTTGERPLQGRPNESNVLKVLVDTISAETNEKHFHEKGDKEDDKRGIDGRVVFPDGSKVPVQVVTTPPYSNWGAAVARGNAKIVASVDDAASWIKAAIDHKVSGADRASLILALDARHAGMLCADDVIAAFHRQMPELAMLGFRAVWLVGNAPVNTKKLA